MPDSVGAVLYEMTVTEVMNPDAGEGRLYSSMNAGSVVSPSVSPGAVLIVSSRSSNPG